ncbi:hypothetical protein M8J76_013784 [Diaphorina citri]|nr:hypothetical protein M8J76_013784 [Diaphorina citri]
MRAVKSASVSSHNSRHSSACSEHRHRTKTTELQHSSDHRKENVVPLSNVYSNSMIAKTLAKENLLHQPLPDNFDDHLNKISDETVDKHDCKNTTAVGCKCYGVPGPTQCSKLKVYRPKTAHELQREVTRPSSNERCPRDCVKADKKEFYSDIDYALCWDLCPPGHPEHKKSQHIDGSNGSLAPAVFSLVPSRDPSPCLYEVKRDGLQSPVPPRALSAKCCPKTKHGEGRVSKAKDWLETTAPANTVNPSAVMTIVKKPEPQENYFSFKQDREPRQDQQKPRCPSCTSNGSRGSNRRREQSPKPWSNEEFVGQRQTEHKRPVDKEEMIEQRLKQRNIHSSSPNLAVHRPENINGSTHNHIPQGHHKNSNPNINHVDKYMNENPHEHHHINGRETHDHHATPNGRSKNRSKVCKEPVCPRLLRSRDSSISSNSRKNGFSPPKLKNHYVKKSYSIPTLSPPFTLWPGTTGQDYPEHWRLASVYQHSYKPIEMRKRNLLQCIYQ